MAESTAECAHRQSRPKSSQCDVCICTTLEGPQVAGIGRFSPEAVADGVHMTPASLQRRCPIAEQHCCKACILRLSQHAAVVAAQAAQSLQAACILMSSAVMLPPLEGDVPRGLVSLSAAPLLLAL